LYDFPALPTLDNYYSDWNYSLEKIMTRLNIPDEIIQYLLFLQTIPPKREMRDPEYDPLDPEL
jgi:hypothetical protein